MDRPSSRLFSIAGTLAVLSGVIACGSEPRRPNVPEGAAAQGLRSRAEPGVRDCGEALESRQESLCRTKPVGDCIEAALKDCRSAQGTRQWFTSEGDSVRVDWFVLSDGQGGCRVVSVEDRSADPLAAKKLVVQECQGLGWKQHESVADCEIPVPENCKEVVPEHRAAPASSS